jgi:hypothetical protein
VGEIIWYRGLHGDPRVRLLEAAFESGEPIPWFVGGVLRPCVVTGLVIRSVPGGRMMVLAELSPVS